MVLPDVRGVRDGVHMRVASAAEDRALLLAQQGQDALGCPCLCRGVHARGRELMQFLHGRVTIGAKGGPRHQLINRIADMRKAQHADGVDRRRAHIWFEIIHMLTLKKKGAKRRPFPVIRLLRSSRPQAQDRFRMRSRAAPGSQASRCGRPERCAAWLPHRVRRCQAPPSGPRCARHANSPA